MSLSAIAWFFLFYSTGFLSIAAASLSQTQVDVMANTLEIRVKVIDNLINDGQNHIVRTTLTNNGATDIPGDGWTLYFHSMLLLFPDVFPDDKTLELDDVEIGMIQGDLYSLRPSTGFSSIKPGESRFYDIVVAFWAVSRTDFMPNWYIASDDETVEPKALVATDMDLTYVESFTEPKQWKRLINDVYNPYTPLERKQLLGYTNFWKVPTKLVIPTPENVTVVSYGRTITFDKTWKIYNNIDEYAGAANYLEDLLCIQSSSSKPYLKAVVFEALCNDVSGSYEIDINAFREQIILKSDSVEGIFYAVQSLRSILDGYHNQNIPTIRIADKPRFQYRGMHIDVARNFHSVDDLKRLIEAMAMYKLNKLHIHLTDDEGWRLEIPGLPELTEVGGNRCHDLTERECIIPQFGSGPTTTSHGSGYYTVDEYKSILAHAKKHFISVIPEIDTPGHSHAAIKSMEARYHELKNTDIALANKYRLIDPDDSTEYLSVQQWIDNAINPCIESTYTFISKVMKEIKDIHSAVQPLEIFHFGGDEVASGAWTDSPICQNFLANNPQYATPYDLKLYFASRVAEIVDDLGLSLGGWEDGFVDAEAEPMTTTDLSNVELFVMPWNNIWEWGRGSQAYKYANADYKVIIAHGTNLYFDHPQEPDPEERGLYWATRFTDTKKVLKFLPDSLYDNIETDRLGREITKTDICGADLSECEPLNKPENIIGIQGHLWSETIRTSENIDFMIFPRLLALAERAWHKAEFEEPELGEEMREQLFEMEWESFARTLGEKELDRLEEVGIQYRIPPPGASVTPSGRIKPSTTYPGLVVQYKVDDGAWKDLKYYTKWQTNMYLRAGNHYKTRFSRPVLLTKD